MNEITKEKLTQYMYGIHGGQGAFADAAGIDRSHLSHCIKGTYKVGKKTAMKIHKATHGEVTFTELLKG